MCASVVSQQEPLQIPELEKWRFVSYDGTLLFNFKNSTISEDEAIAHITGSYKNAVMGIRRVVSQSLPRNWIVIDTCFVTNKERLRALKHGVTLNDGIKVFPVTTCLNELKYTCLTLEGAPLLPKYDEIMSNLRNWAKSILSNINKQYFVSRPLSLTAEPLVVWMGTDSSGIYRGKGSAVFRGYDARFTTNCIYFDRSAYDYPRKSATVKGCYMYCEKCRAFNSHDSVDCVVDFDESPETAKRPLKEDIQNENTSVQQNAEEQDQYKGKSNKRKLENEENQEEGTTEEDEQDDNCSNSSFTMVMTSTYDV
ncbi:hypothetical protein BJV82DRAFT_663207 [Fennellomyces sp. T-0311]|nr:hypothetical protein BJV82DRAFT_663207 [Fennellomyces sp. T-0311]